MPETKEVKGATIKSVNKYSVMSKAHIGKGEALFWHSAPWSSQIVEGFTADLILEERDNKDKTKKEWWIASVNGQPDKVQRQGGGRGGPVEHKDDPKRNASIQAQQALIQANLWHTSRGLKVGPNDKSDTPKDVLATADLFLAWMRANAD